MEWNTPTSNTLCILFVLMVLTAANGLYMMHNNIDPFKFPEKGVTHDQSSDRSQCD